MSIWDGGWADQPEAEREGDWCNGNPEPSRGEDSPPEEEFDDEAGDEWKPNHWPSVELAGPEYKMFQKRQDEKEDGSRMATTDEQPKEQPNEQPEDGDALDLGPGLRVQLAQQVSHEPPLRLLLAEYALMEREWCEIQRLMRGGR